MDAIPRENPRKEGRKQIVDHGTVLLPLGLLVLVNSSHKKHSDRYLVSGLLCTRSLSWLDAVGTLPWSLRKGNFMASVCHGADRDRERASAGLQRLQLFTHTHNLEGTKIPYG